MQSSTVATAIMCQELHKLSINPGELFIIDIIHYYIVDATSSKGLSNLPSARVGFLDSGLSMLQL